MDNLSCRTHSHPRSCVQYPVTPTEMVLEAFDGELIQQDKPRLMPCDLWFEHWGQDKRRTVQGHFWPVCHAVKASPTHLMLEVWGNYPMLVVKRKDWKQCSPGREVIPLPAYFMEEQ
jgi:hypothetical protein